MPKRATFRFGDDSAVGRLRLSCSSLLMLGLWLVVTGWAWHCRVEGKSRAQSNGLPRNLRGNPRPVVLGH